MKTQKTSKGLIGTGIVAAVATSLCCITPVLALVAGSSGLASGFSWLEPFRPYLIGITVVVLGFAWYQKLKPRTAAEIQCACEEDDSADGKKATSSFWQSKKFLGIVTVFAVLMMAFPYYSAVFYPDNKKEVVYVNTSDIVTVNMDIEGMTCSSCNNHVIHAAYEVDGVIGAEADYKSGKAIVQFDQSKTTAEEVLKAIDMTGYKVVNREIKK